jgi:hypothetical protein
MPAGALPVCLSAFRVYEGHDSDRACAFDRDGQLPLMVGAIARDPSGHNFASFRYEVIENDRIFVVNFNIGVRAEAAEFSSVEKFLLVRT